MFEDFINGFAAVFVALVVLILLVSLFGKEVIAVVIVSAIAGTIYALYKKVRDL